MLPTPREPWVRSTKPGFIFNIYLLKQDVDIHRTLHSFLKPCNTNVLMYKHAFYSLKHTWIEPKCSEHCLTNKDV